MALVPEDDIRTAIASVMEVVEVAECGGISPLPRPSVCVSSPRDRLSRTRDAIADGDACSVGETPERSG